MLTSAGVALLLGVNDLPTVLISAVAAIGYGLSGGLLARARPANALGWLLLLAGACAGAAAVLPAWASSPGAADATGRAFAAWLASWVWFPALALVPTVLLALYPSGRAGSRRRRLLIAAGAAGTAGVCVALAFAEDGVNDIVPGLENPYAAEHFAAACAVFGFATLVPAVLLTVADAVRRLWRACTPEREQLAWFLLTVVALVVCSYTPWVPLRAAVQALVPVAIAVGVLRHRLLDLQVVVRRTLLFSALTALVVAVFALSTAALSGVADGVLPAAVAAALVAVSLTPARDRLQRAVDRVVYGDRRDPLRAVATLHRDVAEHDDARLVPQVLRSVAAAVRSPHVVLLGPDGSPLGRAGEPAPGEPLRLPLQVGGRPVGCLEVGPRTARDHWSAEDRALLSLLAAQVAVVAHAASLNADLLASRDRVLQATAEERRRLRQELHDGLGPALSGIALGLEAVEASLATSPDRAQVLLERLRLETQTAGREVRRLVTGLRPAALDGRTLHDALTSFLDGVGCTGSWRSRRCCSARCRR